MFLHAVSALSAMSARRCVVAAVVAAAGMWPALAVDAGAQDYPTRPIRLVVPYPPGSGTDIVARLLAQRMSDDLRQQVFVENRPGAGATTGVTSVAKAEPDGYTILMADLGPLAMAPSFYRQLAYDPVVDGAGWVGARPASAPPHRTRWAPAVASGGKCGLIIRTRRFTIETRPPRTAPRTRP